MKMLAIASGGFYFAGIFFILGSLFCLNLKIIIFLLKIRPLIIN
jgi:hypothetical protein